MAPQHSPDLLLTGGTEKASVTLDDDNPQGGQKYHSSSLGGVVLH
jgi:hypothetical protein